MLHYDVIAQKYIGWYGRLPVIVDCSLFDVVVAMLLCEGVEEADARLRLLQVTEWVDPTEAPIASTCLACNRQVEPGRRFCSVVCEASRLVARLAPSTVEEEGQRLPLR